MAFDEEALTAPQMVAHAWHHNGRTIPEPPPEPEPPGAPPKSDEQRALEIWEAIRSREYSDEELFIGGPSVDGELLAEAVADLRPDLDAGQRTVFRAQFSLHWRHVESRRRLRAGKASVPGLCSGEVVYSDVQSFFMKTLHEIVRRPTPVGSNLDMPVNPGDRVSYPMVLARMMEHDSASYGEMKRYIGGRSHDGVVQVTHRQLSLHAEFAPLLAALCLSSRMPRSLVNRRQVKDDLFRPLLSELIQTLVLRRPDNLEDDLFLAYLRWFAAPRPSLLEEPNQSIIG